MIPKILNHVDFEQVNNLLEGFNKSTGFVTAILDLDGNILSKSGWRQICTDFHRKNPKTALNCYISDTALHEKSKTGEKYHFYECLNGLIDVRLPIVIKGEHVANLFSGQFFFEKPDISFFIKQAQTYGFDEDAYLEALGKVPVVSKEKVEGTMDFLLNITRLIIEMTADKIEQIEINEVIRKNEIALSETQDQLKQNLKDLSESQRIAHLGTWRLDLATNQVVWSDELYKMYGFDPAIPPPPYTEHMKLFTPESWQKLSTSLENAKKTGIPYELELETVTREGSNGWMWVRGEAERDSEGNITSLWGAAQDITEYKKIEFDIKQNEEKFQILFEKAPLGYLALDSEGCFIAVNQKWLDMFGYYKEEVIGKWLG
ncbi:PocR ligand-binding domain-containing protein, partial [bacterium]|nr:PocR ligand-binding domain-containing protein [candidate division CSSED10-310 bacterium]